MHSTRASRAGFCFVIALGYGCSSAEEPAVSRAQFPEAFAEAWCKGVAPCCASERAAYDEASCRAQAREAAAQNLTLRSGADTNYSMRLGTNCLASLEQSLHDCRIEEASVACDLIFTGPLPLGAPCANGSACSTGYCALSEVSSGVCKEAVYVAPVHGKVGAPCVGSCGGPSLFDCPVRLLPSSEGRAVYCYASEGLYCAFDSEAIDALSCQPYAGLDADCRQVTCAPGSFCKENLCTSQTKDGRCDDAAEACNVQSYCGPSGNCLSKKPNGERCSLGDECISSSCSAGPGDAEGSCDSGSLLLARACSGTP